MKSSTSLSPQVIQRQRHILDASDQTLGRFASQIAKLLIGKNKTYFVSHQDTGDYVVVVNSDKIKVTGNKLAEKVYYRHSGYPGGMKITTMEKQMEKDSRRVIEHAVRGMLPKTKLGDKMFKKLFVSRDNTHPNEAKVKGDK